MPEETKETNPVSPQSSSPAEPQVAPAGEPGTAADSAAVSAAPQVPVAVPGDKPVPAAKPAATPATAAAAKPATPAAKPAPPKPEAPKPEPWDSDLVRSLKAQYGSGIREANSYVGQKYLVVDSSIVYEILLRLRDDERFNYCVDITAVHYPKRDAQFDIVYILYSFPNNQRIRVKTQIKDGERLRSAFSIWPTANWLEREIFDMFGISFDEHPELKRILMPDDWTGHPLRKDYGILQQDQAWVKKNVGIESGQ